MWEIQALVHAPWGEGFEELDSLVTDDDCWRSRTCEHTRARAHTHTHREAEQLVLPLGPLANELAPPAYAFLEACFSTVRERERQRQRQ